jgi:hypothetical protein
LALGVPPIAPVHGRAPEGRVGRNGLEEQARVSRR